MDLVFNAEEGGALFIPPEPAGELETFLILLVLGLPLAGFLLTGLVGRRWSRPWLISVAAIVAATLIATYLAFQQLSGAYGEHGIEHMLYTWIGVGDLAGRVRLRLDNLTGADAHRGHLDRRAGAHLQHRLHGARPRQVALLRLPQPVHVLACCCWCSRAATWSSSRPGSWWACPPTCSSASGTPSVAPALASKKAFLVNRVADLGFLVGHHGHLPHHRDDGHLRVVRRLEHRPRSTRSSRNTVALLLFVGAAGKSAQFPLPRLAARRDGGPDPGLRAHPCRDHGQRRRLLHRPHHARSSPPRPRRMLVVARDRHFTADPGRDHRADPEGHQARAGLLDAEPAGLHVRGPGRGRLAGGHLPPHGPRLHQGPALPGLRLGHPRRARRAGHDQDGRALAQDPVDPLRPSSSARSRSPASRSSPASSRRT